MARGKDKSLEYFEIGGRKHLPSRDGNGRIKRERPQAVSIKHSNGSVDVHAILFVVLAIVFVVWPAIQWFFGV